MEFSSEVPGTSHVVKVRVDTVARKVDLISMPKEENLEEAATDSSTSTAIN